MKAVIPAAGLGSRLALFTRFMPKALLPVKGKPAIDWAIEEALEAQTEPIVVVSKYAPYLIDYLKYTWQCETVFQEKPIGMDNAINLARPENEPYAVILPDAVTIPFVLEDMLAFWEKHEKLPLVAIAKCPHGIIIPYIFASEKPFWVVGRYIIEGEFRNIPKGNCYVTDSKIITLEEFYAEQNNPT